jgi:hypothetical protein
MSSEQFPVGGLREVVYDALRSRGFTMSGWSDKHWHRRELHAHVYGAGSKLCVKRNNEHVIADGPMADSLTAIDALAQEQP